MSIDQNSYITAASCDCPAGKGPSASCKHVARCSELCTSWILCIRKIARISNMHRQVQQWNKPRPKKVDPILVSEFSKRKFDIKKGNKDIFISQSMLSSLVARQLLDWFKDPGSYSKKWTYYLLKNTLDNLLPPCTIANLYMSICSHINVWVYACSFDSLGISSRDLEVDHPLMNAVYCSTIYKNNYN